MVLLETRGLGRRFGGLQALDSLDMKVYEGEILGLIGPNGAGKSTCINVLSGVLAPSEGQVIFDGQVISGLPPHRIARMGVIRTFQGVTIFPELTVLENVLIGADRHYSWSFPGAVFGSSRYRAMLEARRRRAVQAIEQCGLSDLQFVRAGNLPHGTQRTLSLAIALAAGPRLLMLDEPFSGLATSEIQDLMALLRRVRDSGVTIILVEHHVKAVMGLCDRIVVLHFGRKIAEGTPGEVRSNPDVIKVYLGDRTSRRDRVGA